MLSVPSGRGHLRCPWLSACGSHNAPHLRVWAAIGWGLQEGRGPQGHQAFSGCGPEHPHPSGLPAPVSTRGQRQIHVMTLRVAYPPGGPSTHSGGTHTCKLSLGSNSAQVAILGRGGGPTGPPPHSLNPSPGLTVGVPFVTPRPQRGDAYKVPIPVLGVWSPTQKVGSEHGAWRIRRVPEDFLLRAAVLLSPHLQGLGPGPSPP